MIKGLTTAAGLWTVAGIGLAVGGGLYIAAAFATVLVLIILILVKPYKKKFTKQKEIREITLQVNAHQADLKKIEAITSNYDLQYTQMLIQHTDQENVNNVHITFKRPTTSELLMNVITELKQLDGVYETKFRVE